MEIIELTGPGEKATTKTRDDVDVLGGQLSSGSKLP